MIIIPETEAGGVLTVSTGAIVANWKLLASQAPQTECAAVVKADAYGCGIEAVGKALAIAGCRTFFTAHLSEAKRLRVVAPQAVIYVLNGFFSGTVGEYLRHRLFPVLGSLSEMQEWAAGEGKDHGCALHVDTGMNRLGLRVEEFAHWVEHGRGQPDFKIDLLMSHFACADEPTHPLNARQIESFAAVRQRLPQVKASLANSSGIFLDKAAHHNLLRPGYALYGGNPTPEKSNPMHPVVSLQGRIVQLRDVPAGESIGYSAGFVASKPMRIATVSVGYADGLLRSSGGGKDRPAAIVMVEGVRCPFVGRVSMDLHALDVTAVPATRIKRGDMVDLLGAQITIDALAANAGTIGYEILTSLKRRYALRYS